jgi:membrane protease YdiL (CAAX protease family)
VRALVEKTERPATHRFALAAILGLAVGALLAAADRLLFMPAQPEAIRALSGAIARWKGLLASFYGGLGEEIVTRQFFMSVVTWALVKLTRRRHAVVYVVAAVISALAFAAAHLPAAKWLAPLDVAVVARVLVLNGVAGIAFGLMFWRRGLEHAMVAHFAADLILHVVAP